MDEFLLQFNRSTPECHCVNAGVRQHDGSVAVGQQLQSPLIPEVVVVSGQNNKNIGSFWRVDDEESSRTPAQSKEQDGDDGNQSQ